MSNILSPDKTQLLSADKDTEILHIEDGVIKICKEAFDTANAIEVILPEGVKELEQLAFLRAHKLKSISIPSSLKIIGNEAFRFCGLWKRLNSALIQSLWARVPFMGVSILKKLY